MIARSEDPNLFDSLSYRVETPDGICYVHVLEQKDTPVGFIIQFGKCGTSLFAWAEAVGRMATRALPLIGIAGIIEELSGITTAGLRRLAKGESIRSGPEGIAYALLKYKQEKFKNDQPKRKPGRATTD